LNVKKLITVPVLPVAALLLLSGNAHAVVGVPEIDGSMAAIALGLTAGMVALIRERRKGK
jgi:hypothetical protein